MLAQAAQVLHIQGTASARVFQTGRLTNQLIHKKITGNPDNAYKRSRRHTCTRQGRRRLSKNYWTLHRPRQRARHRLRALVPHT